MTTLTASPDVPKQELAEEERQQKMWDYYEQEVLRGLESGPPVPLTPEYWEKLRKEAQQRREAQKAVATMFKEE
jgi:hypothetical protein